MPDLLPGGKSRACTNCARAKTKCVWPSANDCDESVCLRCSGNNLTCSKLHTISKRRRGKATHGKLIEEKLDGIMSLLTRNQERTPIDTHATTNQAISDDFVTPASRTKRASSQKYPSTSLEPSLEAPSPSQSSTIVIVPDFQVPFHEADQILREYMSTMLPWFPFVPVPSHNAHAMCKDRPLLLKTILWVCRPPDAAESSMFESWFRHHVAHQTVVLMNKSLEIVQAILVFLAWRDIYFYSTSKDTSLLQLAIGLVGDLKLSYRRKPGSSSFGSIVEDAAHLRNDLPPQPKQTSDEYRAVLGVYYIRSILCSVLGKRSRLEYTPHFDHCCRELIHDQEYPTDILLANLIRIRQLAIKAEDVFWDMIDATNDSPFRNVHSIAVAYIRNELEAFLQQLPDYLKSNHLLRIHYAAVRIRLFEPFKHDDKSEVPAHMHLRYRMMWDCLESTQSLFNAFRLVPVESYPSLTFDIILHLALAIIKAVRLLCVEDYAWDLDTARSMYNLPETLRELVKRFETADSLSHSRCGIIVHDRRIFSEYAKAYGDIERWHFPAPNPGVANTEVTMMEPTFAHNGEEYEVFEFWNQLSNLTYEPAPS